MGGAYTMVQHAGSDSVAFFGFTFYDNRKHIYSEYICWKRVQITINV
jgi:hypothetical protein